MKVGTYMIFLTILQECCQLEGCFLWKSFQMMDPHFSMLLPINNGATML